MGQSGEGQTKQKMLMLQGQAGNERQLLLQEMRQEKEMIEELRKEHEAHGCQYKGSCYFYSRGHELTGGAPVEGFPEICDAIEPGKKLECRQYKKEIDFWTKYHTIRKSVGKKKD